MSTVSTKFYSLFWDNEHCRDIFLQHKEQLLEKKELKLSETAKANYYLQRFVLSNSLKSNDTSDRLQGRIYNRHVDISHSLETKKVKNIDEEKVAAYFKNLFARPIEALSRKMDGGSISQIRLLTEIVSALNSEQKLINFLHRYEIVSSNINSFTDIQENLERFFHTEVAKFLNSEKMADLFSSLDEIAGYYDNENFESLMEANKFYMDALYDRENFKDRLELFDMLYEAGCLIGGKFKTYYECTHCDEGVFSGNVRLNVRPKKVKLKCPNCSKDVFYLVPYKIEDSIFNDIKSKDGMLHAAAVNLLIHENFKITINTVLPPDVELDIMILNASNQTTDIIETKMFKTDRPKDTMKSNLREGLVSFIKSRDKLIAANAGTRNVMFHFLTNIQDEELLKGLKNDFSDALSGNRIRIHTADSFQHYFEEYRNH